MHVSHSRLLLPIGWTRGGGWLTDDEVVRLRRAHRRAAELDAGILNAAIMEARRLTDEIAEQALSQGS